MKLQQWRALNNPGQAQASREEIQGPLWCFGPQALEQAMPRLGELPGGPRLLVGEAALLSPWRKRISQAWIEEGLEVALSTFPSGKECTLGLAQALAKEAKAKGAGVLMGWGGGKCLDSVKWAGLLTGLPVVTVPSSPATCACATAVVVAHEDSGEVKELLDLPQAPFLCIADFDILRTAPPGLLSAGMADSLAKWLEWASVEEPQGPGADEAKAAAQALKKAGAPLESLWEACLKLSAEASNLGQAPAAAAHSFCAGISLLPRSLEWLHGEWVALGLLFQARLMEKLGLRSPEGGDFKSLEGLWERLALPTRLPFRVAPDEVRRILQRILAPEESIHLLAAAPSPQALEEAFDSLQP